MAAGLGIAAGAFAQNYAQAMGLRSRLDSEKQQQEANEIKLQRERDFNAAQKELADMHKSFLDTNYDFVNNKPFEAQQGGITPPGQQRPTDPYTDSARVKAYYDRITPLLERQAYATGKDFLGVRKQVDDLRKNQFVERVGSALAMIEAGDEAGIKNLQAVYDMYPDGRKITGGKINQDGTVLLQYEQNGQAGERLLSKDQLVNFGKLALNPADAAKLRFQLIESQKERDFRSGEGQKDRDFRSGEGQKDRDFRSGEGQKDRDFRSGEGQKDRDFRSGEGQKDRDFRVGEGNKDRSSRERISADDNRSRERVAADNRAAEEPTRRARGIEAEAAAETRTQNYFNSRFQVDSKFAPKNESDLRGIGDSAREAYQRDLDRWNNSTKLSRTATNIAAANQGVPLAKIAEVTERLNDGKMEVFKEDSSGRRFVNSNGKRIYLD